MYICFFQFSTVNTVHYIPIQPKSANQPLLYLGGCIIFSTYKVITCNYIVITDKI